MSFSMGTAYIYREKTLYIKQLWQIKCAQLHTQYINIIKLAYSN